MTRLCRQYRVDFTNRFKYLHEKLFSSQTRVSKQTSLDGANTLHTSLKKYYTTLAF